MVHLNINCARLDQRMPSLLDDVVALGEVCDEPLLERVDEGEVDDDDEEGHDGRRHTGDRVAR